MTSSDAAASRTLKVRPAVLALVAGFGLIAALGVVVVWLQISRERHFTAAEPAQQVLYVQSPAVLSRLALSYDTIVSDVYWIRTIQYYGGIRLSRDPTRHYDLLYPLLDLTTSLDPQFTIAYRFGAFFLSERAPGGAGRPDLAVTLLQKAMAANPDRWEYPHDVGFVYYRYGDYVQAADWFRRAAKVPGATNWLEPLAAVTLAAGGQTTAARVLWQNLLATTDQEWLRTTAQHRLRQLDAIEAIAALRKLTAEYERRHGDPPPSWQALIADGALRAVPTDPEGYVYALNPWWGTVDINDQSPLWPLPTERAP